MLAEICDLNKRGDFKGCYQLKMEYLNANRSGAAMAIAPSIPRSATSERVNEEHGSADHEMGEEEYENEDGEDSDEELEMEDVTPY